MSEQIPDGVKSERLLELQTLIDTIQAKFNQDCAGQTFDVLFEKEGRKPGQSVGRSVNLQPVHVDAVIEPGTILPVRVDAVHAYSLFGTLAQAAHHTHEAFDMAGA